MKSGLHASRGQGGGLHLVFRGQLVPRESFVDFSPAQHLMVQIMLLSRVKSSLEAIIAIFEIRMACFDALCVTEQKLQQDHCVDERFRQLRHPTKSVLCHPRHRY